MGKRVVAGVPRYLQIRGSLRDRIEGGEFPSGRLPTLRALCREYRVAPNTLRNAMGGLMADGVVVARQGSGYFVGRGPVSWPIRLALLQWVPMVVAEFALGRALGLCPVALGFDEFVSDRTVVGVDMVGDAVRSALLALVEGEVLEYRRGDGDGEVRWSLRLVERGVISR